MLYRHLPLPQKKGFQNNSKAANLSINNLIDITLVESVQMKIAYWKSNIFGCQKTQSHYFQYMPLRIFNSLNELASSVDKRSNGFNNFRLLTDFIRKLRSIYKYLCVYNTVVLIHSIFQSTNGIMTRYNSTEKISCLVRFF